MTTHIMCDIETLGTRPGFVVLSAAFVRFSDEASVSLNLSVPDQVSLGLEIDPDTHAWWGTQPAETWAAATRDPMPLATALPYIGTWLQWAAGGDEMLLWCRGFMDTPMLQEVYRRAGVPCPWQHWQTESSRTLAKLACLDVRPFAVLPSHIALNDALGDTRAANAAMTILARAHSEAEPTTILRYFHHPESECVFHTSDGSAPSDGLSEEINGGEFLDMQKMYAEATS